MKSVSDTIKSIVMVLLVICLGVLSSMKLIKLQIVEGDEAVTAPRYDSDAITYKREVSPTRGEILDYRGNVIIGNNAQINLVLQYAFFPKEYKEGNAILLRLYNELAAKNHIFEEILPITLTAPYEYTQEDTTAVTERLNLNVYATAENCIDKLISDSAKLLRGEAIDKWSVD
jgi:penicillin-binding protein 2